MTQIKEKSKVLYQGVGSLDLLSAGISSANSPIGPTSDIRIVHAAPCRLPAKAGMVSGLRAAKSRYMVGNPPKVGIAFTCYLSPLLQ